MNRETRETLEAKTRKIKTTYGIIAILEHLGRRRRENQIMRNRRSRARRGGDDGRRLLAHLSFLFSAASMATSLAYSISERLMPFFIMSNVVS